MRVFYKNRPLLGSPGRLDIRSIVGRVMRVGCLDIVVDRARMDHFDQPASRIVGVGDRFCRLRRT